MAKKNEQHDPNAENKCIEPAYITELVKKSMERNGLTNQRAVAERIGVGYTTLKDWKAGTRKPSYTDQYTLERLAGV